MQDFSRYGIDIAKEKPENIVIYEIACTYSLLEKKIAEYLRPFNLSPIKFNVLMVVKHQGKDKGLSQIDISSRLIISASNMTRLLDRMSKEGLIVRSSQQGDRRVNLVKITKKGSALLDKVWPGYYTKMSEIGSSLNRNELKQVSSLLVKWIEKMIGQK